MKLEKEELIEKINGLEVSDDIKIPLLEDITDSIGEKDTKELDDMKLKLDDVSQKYDELKEKYKERFLEGSTKEIKETEEKGLEEKNYIDIREI